MTWSTDDIPDLTGRRAIVTGVTGGLGLHTAIGLARKGAELVVTARDAAKAISPTRAAPRPTWRAGTTASTSWSTTPASC
jgi:NAD(P)-dependent dehydrogenase (short-subunit alcohol dehydrogenase family)